MYKVQRYILLFKSNFLLKLKVYKLMSGPIYIHGYLLQK